MSVNIIALKQKSNDNAGFIGAFNSLRPSDAYMRQ